VEADMKKPIALLLVSMALGCATGQTSPAYSRDSAYQLNADRRYAHASNGQIILGPSTVNEIVSGQRDVAGNVHVDPLPHPEGVHRF
jgi:hypothetical protein